MASDASTTPAKPSSRAITRRLTAFIWLVYLLATLLAFPCHLTVLTCLIALGIFVCLVLQRCRQAACASLITAVLLTVKTPSNQIDFILMVAVFLVAGIIYFSNRTKLRWLSFAITTAAVAFFGIKRTLDAQPSQAKPLSSTSDRSFAWATVSPKAKMVGTRRNYKSSSPNLC